MAVLLVALPEHHVTAVTEPFKARASLPFGHGGIHHELGDLLAGATVPVNIVAVVAVFSRRRADAVEAKLARATDATHTAAAVIATVFATALGGAAHTVAGADLLRLAAVVTAPEAGAGTFPLVTDDVVTFAHPAHAAATVFPTVIFFASRSTAFELVGAHLIGAATAVAAHISGAGAVALLAHHVHPFAYAAGAATAVTAARLALTLWKAAARFAFGNADSVFTVKLADTKLVLFAAHVLGAEDPAPVSVLLTHMILGVVGAHDLAFFALVAVALALSFLTHLEFSALATRPAATVVAAVFARTVLGSHTALALVADLPRTTFATVLHRGPTFLGVIGLATGALVGRVHGPGRHTCFRNQAEEGLDRHIATLRAACVVGALQAVVALAARPAATVAAAVPVAHGGAFFFYPLALGASGENYGAQRRDDEEYVDAHAGPPLVQCWTHDSSGGLLGQPARRNWTG